MLELVFDWIIRIESSPSVSTKIVAKKALNPSLQKWKYLSRELMPVGIFNHHNEVNIIKYICNSCLVCLSGMYLKTS